MINITFYEIYFANELKKFRPEIKIIDMKTDISYIQFKDKPCMSKTRQVFPTNLKRKNVWILWVVWPGKNFFAVFECCCQRG